MSKNTFTDWGVNNLSSSSPFNGLKVSESSGETYDQGSKSAQIFSTSQSVYSAANVPPYLKIQTHAPVYSLSGHMRSGILKRLFDLFFSIFGIALLLPLMLIITIVVVVTSPGAVFFRQVRVGQYGRPFLIYKFRTMVDQAESFGKQITIGEDTRVTKFGRFLRKYKLDELPQLLNVLKGEMSFVGPRPEVPKYVAKYPPKVKEIVLSVRPGITDLASIKYRNESEILATVEQKYGDPERVYIEQILPVKLSYYVQYVHNQSFWMDIKIIFKTLGSLIG
jgi:lipopolysaccharide/colanic/teichoic acid biosynthesis glycosyltransferase